MGYADWVRKLSLGAVLTCVACASSPAPSPRFGQTEAVVGGAEQASREGSNPQAALYMKLAREELAKAKMLQQEGNAERAELMLLRSQADAQLAAALSQQSKHREETKGAVDEVRELREQTAPDAQQPQPPVGP